MNVKETLIFIKRPIEELASALRPDSKSVDGNEVTYYFEGQGPEGADFGLSADLDAPDGSAWSHLLMEDLEPDVLIGLLKLLRIEPKEIQAATDWNGNPLVNLEPIRKTLAAKKLAAAAKTAGKEAEKATALDIGEENARVASTLAEEAERAAKRQARYILGKIRSRRQ